MKPQEKDKNGVGILHYRDMNVYRKERERRTEKLGASWEFPRQSRPIAA